jgi:outer membrane protein assembly factor BamB
MRALRIAAAVMALAALPGCSWSPLVAMGIRSAPAHPPTPLAPITSSVSPKAVWTASIGKSGGFSFRPDVEGGRIYTAAADGTISMLEEDTGRLLGRIDAGRKLSGGVEVGEGRIVVGTLKGEVIALDITGKVAWSTIVNGEVIAPAAVSRKMAVVRTSDGRIFGLSMADGKRVWVFQRPTPALLLRSSAGVLALGGDVIAGYPNGKLIALDIDDGKLTWEVSVAQPRGTTELERIADVAGLPVVDGTSVCAAAFQGKVACFEIQSRTMTWARDVSSARAVARDAKRVYVVDDTGAVQALDNATGASIWKQDKLAYRRLTDPILVDGRIVVGDGFGFLHVLSPEDGALVGRLALDGTAVQSMVSANGGIAVQTAGGSVSLVRM